ncbi:hypothetical protein [Sulfurospirillum arcachonense]|uniref:hypothetical protein n=1 Tax=Sulfurospirillum arcachonense TaxID=57666 RepID=UPI00046A52D0|nr:hypothetical protein [Sulfurospirillum arcachonense]
MKSPKGFRKNYFTFAAILAHSVFVRLHNIALQFDFYLKKNFSQKEEQDVEENSPPNELFQSCLFIKIRPSHCNCIFARKTKIIVALFHYIPRCPYYNTYFAFRRTGVHPPTYP